ncbi:MULTISPECIES: hypothetical protein [unclassified Streptomyces]
MPHATHWLTPVAGLRRASAGFGLVRTDRVLVVAPALAYVL